jgi:hypothetical protein
LLSASLGRSPHAWQWRERESRSNVNSEHTSAANVGDSEHFERGDGACGAQAGTVKLVQNVNTLLRAMLDESAAGVSEEVGLLWTAEGDVRDSLRTHLGQLEQVLATPQLHPTRVSELRRDQYELGQYALNAYRLAEIDERNVRRKACK